MKLTWSDFKFPIGFVMVTSVLAPGIGFVSSLVLVVGFLLMVKVK